MHHFITTCLPYLFLSFNQQHLECIIAKDRLIAKIKWGKKSPQLIFSKKKKSIKFHVNLLSRAHKWMRRSNQFSHVQSQICYLIAQQISQWEIWSLIADNFLSLTQRSIPFIFCLRLHHNFLLHLHGSRNATKFMLLLLSQHFFSNLQSV